MDIFFFYKKFALPWIYQSNHIKILPLIYIVKKKGNWIIMKNIHDQGFFLHHHLHHLLRRKTKSSNISCRHQIKYDVCNITLHGVSFLLYAKNTIYTLYDTFRLSLDTGLWCINRNLSNFETKKILLMNVYIHFEQCQMPRELNVLLLFHF